MRKITILSLIFLLISLNSEAQLSKFVKKLTNKSLPLTNTEIVNGLKEALLVATDSSVSHLSAVDGYLKDLTVKILLPPEAKPIIDNLSKIPGGEKLVDDVITRINRAAEDAAKEAKPIFVNSVREMTFTNGLQILNGPDNAATQYFEQKTSQKLSDLYRPKIRESLNKELIAGISTTQSWNELTIRWNQMASSSLGRIAGLKTVDVKLEDYLLQQALKGMFLKISIREKEIRTQTKAQVTTLLKKVFGNQKAQ
jgi:hypothetical protein